LLESEQPLAVTQYAFVPDTGGPGEYRGGLSLVRRIRFLGDEAIMQVRSDRRDFSPWGLAGGGAGNRTAVSLMRANGTEESPPGKFLTTVRKGDEICIWLASGGGYGDPLLRDAARVLQDVIDEKSTIAKVRDDYGVVIAGDPLQVDLAATQALRRDMQAARR